MFITRTAAHAASPDNADHRIYQGRSAPARTVVVSGPAGEPQGEATTRAGVDGRSMK
jgi:hypothetical protein